MEALRVKFFTAQGVDGRGLVNSVTPHAGGKSNSASSKSRGTLVRGSFEFE